MSSEIDHYFCRRCGRSLPQPSMDGFCVFCRTLLSASTRGSVTLPTPEW
jgi:hypothetical protein